MKTERNQKWTGNGTNFCHFVGGCEPASSVAGSCHRGRIQAAPVESHPRIDGRTTSESYSRSYQTRQRGQINKKKWRNEWREWWIVKRWNVPNLLMFYSLIEYLEILPIWARHSRRSLPTSPSLHFRLRRWRRRQKDATKSFVNDFLSLLCLSPSSHRLWGS